ncbi:hypothetical protein JQS43_20405 [Natronosporangium hydrolyticum]|uniref:Uncharacterized protein n=1 Tax=Natronosporangium hydrolyticum TaxID=2811111 RepID=A0A895YEQ5_9ACTN|nr:hypothetical protein [Natronosporangium hydrolyticum]QSB13889.1 hypothetical protein JQS43_20405 [Natronosporangium hydrolyticum]
MTDEQTSARDVPADAADDAVPAASAAGDQPAPAPAAGDQPAPVTVSGGQPTPVAPAAGVLAVLALAWLLAMLSSARQAIGDSPDADPLTVTRAALELPQVISASLIAGIAVGLTAVNLLSRLAGAAARRRLPRFGTGAGAGLLTGVAVATPILLGYDGLPSILVLSGAVAAAAMLGGLLAGVREGAVVAAGAVGALVVFVVGLLERIFEGDLRSFFGAGETAESVIAASGWASLTASLAAGVAAGAVGYVYLRRVGGPNLRWPAFLVAGALPGLLILIAEAVTRIAGTRLFQLVSAASADDQAVLNYFNAARFNRALIVLVVGAVVATVLIGRTLRAADPASSEDDGQPASAGTN